MNTHNKKGFTLVELLVVVAIIGVLASIVFIALSGTTAKARDTKRKNDINQIGRFLTFGCLTPTAGAGEYDLKDILDEMRSRYPQYANSLPANIRDPKSGTDTASNYKYIVDADGKCVLYANLENQKEEVTMPNLTAPTPGAGRGVLQGSTVGPNGSNKYFQISN